MSVHNLSVLYILFLHWRSKLEALLCIRKEELQTETIHVGLGVIKVYGNICVSAGASRSALMCIV